MKVQLEKRLQQLKAEFESGQQVLTELEVKQANLRETLLRISGAIQVLEEELALTEEIDEPLTTNQTVDSEPSLEANGHSTLSNMITS